MATVARLLPHVLQGAATAPPTLAHRRLVIVADELLAAPELRTLFPNLDLAVVVRDAGAARAFMHDASSPQVRDVYWDPQLQGGISAAEARVIRRAGATVVFLKPHAECSGRMFRDLHRSGLRSAIFDEGGRWRRVSLARAILGKARLTLPFGLASDLARPALSRLSAAVDRSILGVVRTLVMEGASPRRDGINHESIARFEQALAVIERPREARRQGQRIMHFVSSLDSGGAERQVVNMTLAQQRRGLDASVRTQVALCGERAHNLPVLESHDVDAAQAGAIDIAAIEVLALRVRETPGLAEALRRIPPAIRGGVLDIFGELMLHQPAVLHGWLDEPNVLGGVAGLLAGVPRILLSTRNVNPSRFPHLHRPWMRPWYRLLARRPNVLFAGNSLAGIADYAQWLSVEAGRFILLRNAIEPEAFTPPPARDIEGFRREVGLSDGQPLIAGVMRLSIEKRPDLFVEAIRRVRMVHPQCRAVLAGVGPLEGEVRRRIASLHLEGAIQLLGQRRDVNVILAAADVVLLTSDHEGTPNCLLEALALGKAVAATEAGGTTEVIEHECTGLLAERGDVEALAAAVNRLLKNPALASAYGAAGRTRVRDRFALDGVVDGTLAAYFG